MGIRTVPVLPLLRRFEYIDRMSGHVLGRALFALLPFCPRVGIWTPSNTWFFDHTRVHIPNDISIFSVIFARLTIVTDRQTDRQTAILRL